MKNSKQGKFSQKNLVPLKLCLIIKHLLNKLIVVQNKNQMLNEKIAEMEIKFDKFPFSCMLFWTESTLQKISEFYSPIKNV
jgi:hypothetical protein